MDTLKARINSEVGIQPELKLILIAMIDTIQAELDLKEDAS